MHALGDEKKKVLRLLRAGIRDWAGPDEPSAGEIEGRYLALEAGNRRETCNSTALVRYDTIHCRYGCFSLIEGNSTRHSIVGAASRRRVVQPVSPLRNSLFSLSAFCLSAGPRYQGWTRDSELFECPCVYEVRSAYVPVPNKSTSTLLVIRVIHLPEQLH